MHKIFDFIWIECFFFLNFAVIKISSVFNTRKMRNFTKVLEKYFTNLYYFLKLVYKEISDSKPKNIHLVRDKMTLHSPSVKQEEN